MKRYIRPQGRKRVIAIVGRITDRADGKFIGSSPIEEMQSAVAGQFLVAELDGMGDTKPERQLRKINGLRVYSFTRFDGRTYVTVRAETEIAYRSLHALTYVLALRAVQRGSIPRMAAGACNAESAERAARRIRQYAAARHVSKKL
jgi:hypothetical protein